MNTNGAVAQERRISEMPGHRTLDLRRHGPQRLATVLAVFDEFNESADEDGMYTDGEAVVDFHQTMEWLASDAYLIKMATIELQAQAAL